MMTRTRCGALLLVLMSGLLGGVSSLVWVATPRAQTTTVDPTGTTASGTESAGGSGATGGLSSDNETRIRGLLTDANGTVPTLPVQSTEGTKPSEAEQGGTTAPVTVESQNGRPQVRTVGPGASVESLSGSGVTVEAQGGVGTVERLGGADVAPVPEGATAPVRVDQDRMINSLVREEIRDPTRFYRGVDTTAFWDKIRVGDRTGALQVLKRMQAQNDGWSASPSMMEALQVDTRPFWERIQAGDRAGAKQVLQQLRTDNPDWYPTSNMIQALTTVDTRPFWARMEAGDRAGARAVLANLRAKNPDWVPDRRMMEALTTVDTRPFWDRIQANDRPGARAALRDLRREYPDWTPTPDMLEALQVDTRPFWAKVRAGDAEGAKAALDALKAASPTWTPSKDITNALSLMRLSGLAKNGRYGEIVALSQSEPELFSCDRIEALWWLADAYAALRQKQSLSALYRRILTQCPAPSPEDLGITLQKASAQLPTEEFAAYAKAINAAGWPTDARARYDQATQGLESKRLQEAIESGKIAAVERVVSENPAIQRDAALTNLVAYFLLNKKKPAQAGPWFERSLSLKETFAARQGLVLALVRTGQLDKAATVANAAPEKRAALRRIVGDAYADAATRAVRRGKRSEAQALTAKAAALGVRRPGPSAVGVGYERLNKGDAQGALERFVASYKRRPTPASATGITLALKDLGRLTEARKMACGWSAKAANLAQLCQDMLASEASVLLEQGQYTQVLSLAQTAGSGATSDMRALAAWSYYNLQDYPRAEAAFRSGLAQDPDNQDMLEGLALTLMNAGHASQAMDIACPNAGSSSSQAHVCADASATLANEFFKAKDYASVIRICAAARAAGADNANLAQLEGWALLREGRAAEASQRFEVAYRANPQSGAGEGLLEALTQSGDVRQTQYIVQNLDPSLQQAWRLRAQETYLDRSQYLMAHQALGDSDPVVRGLGEPELIFGTFFRQRSGEDGQDAFTGRYGKIEMTDAITGFHGYPASWSVRVEGVDIDIGDPASDDAIGSQGKATAVDGAWVTSPTTGATIFQVHADFRQEAPNSTVEGSVGYGPIGGEVGPVPLGRLAVTGYGDGVTGTATAFAESRTDSLLSMSGMVDPYTGKSWGRVVESGLKAGASFDVSEKFSVSGELLASYLTGDGVADNYRMRGTVSAAYDFKPDGFKFLRVGPSLMMQSYDKNLSEFTLGHGGYFSPQSNTTAGLFVDFLTAEGKNWQIGGRAFAGLTYSEEDATPVFPKNDDGQRYPASSSEGVSTELELRGAWQVAPRWQLGGLLRHSTAPDYEDTAVGMTLRYTFGDREGVLSRDLPTFVDRGRQ